MSTHNICFRGEIRKNIMGLPPPIWSYVSVQCLLASCCVFYRELIHVAVEERVIQKNGVSTNYIC